jgi:nitrate/TMAO reductase-like tetraheme cytochrome c subunit
MTQATHAFVRTTCNTCHEAGLSFYMGAASPALQGRPADHTAGSMVAPNDCSLCHTTANWNSTVLPAGHMPNPANEACTVCHTTAPADYSTTTLAANAVLHTGVTSSQCAQCHGGTAPLTWYNNFTPKDGVLTPSHIPYLAGTSCGSCHSSTTYAVGSFGPMNMTQATHAFVRTTCNTCHEAGFSFYMGAASPTLQGRPADHTAGQMVAPNDCSICHTTANWNSTVVPTGHMPNPANQVCTVCHTTAPADYSTTTLAANNVLHTGITTGCITCHGAPNATPPVFYLNYTPKDAVLSPVHIPTSTTACESCHAVSFTTFSGTTMTAAKHTSMFAVIGKTCDACHDLSTLKFYGVTRLTTRPNGHHVGVDCSGCHNPNNWGGGAAKKKTIAAAAAPTRAVIGTVVAAPAAGASAVSAANVASAATVGRLGTATAGAVRLSHAGVTGNCASCHNGVLAAGKGPTHITSNNACQNCHTTFGWLPARFDHQGVTAPCVSCHNGVTAPGKPALHMQANQDCSACHGTLAWTPVAFSHLGVSATCQSCHNGVTAAGKQAQHVVTTLDCGSCHNTLGWTIVSAPAARPRTLIPAPRGSTGGSIK